MSQQQQHRPEAVKYGDVFQVSGELASKPIAPKDAATMQAAENIVLGGTPKGGVAAVMQSAADLNERRGVVGHDDINDVVREEGATISETESAGYRVISESIGGQVLREYGQPVEATKANPISSAESDACTIGEALEAAAIAAENKPVEESDAAAIQEAEARATGLDHVVPGGVAEEAKSAAAHNVQTTRDEDKIKLGDVLADATEKLIADKAVTRKDADRVMRAEARNDPDAGAHPGGVAASMVAAAKLNQK